MAFNLAEASTTLLEFKLDPPLSADLSKAQTCSQCRTSSDSCATFLLFCLDKEVAGCLPNLLAFDAVVVQHVGRAVHSDAQV